LAQPLAEVLAGARPAYQLRELTSPDVLSLLQRNSGRFGALRQPTVVSVHLSQPSDGSAEACAVIDTGQRKRVIAFRLDHHDGRWTCTAVHLG
jgi:Family of unknown function (DUF6459)